MYTLFIDTHSKEVVIVLFKDAKILGIKKQTSNNSHSSVLMTMIADVFNNASILPSDLNEIIVVNGPGSFTGIRIGITVAKTLAYSLNIDIREIDYFQVLAASTNNINRQIIISDPKGYYVGLFDEKNELISDYEYYLIKNFTKKDDYLLIDENIEVDYEQVYRYSRNLVLINPHSVKPLYIKKIEVEK